MTFSFNLIDSPWIPCIDIEGRAVELSLQETLVRAHTLRELGGESPLVTAALYRLLLAVTHRVYNGPEGYDAWAAIWEARRFDAAKIVTYLTHWRERFDLFHPERPFYQVADDRVKAGSITTLTHDLAYGAMLFDHHSQDIAFTPVEAALALLVAQSFKFCGTKGPTMQFTDAPWARDVIFFIAGDNLYETLMFNLFRYPDEHIIGDNPKDCPAWEMDDPFLPNRSLPLGYLDYLTWQNRRVMMFPEQTSRGILVNRITVAPGLRLSERIIDPLKHYIIKDKKNAPTPLRFSEDRALWRDSTALFELDNEKHHPLRAFQWIAALIEEGYLEESRRYHYFAFGLASELGKDKTNFYRSERYPLPIEYLQRKTTLDALKDAIQMAENVSNQLWGAARTLAFIALKPDVDPQDRNVKIPPEVSNMIEQWGIKRQYWAQLEVPFRRILEQVPQDRDAALTEWQQTLRRAAWRAFDGIAENLAANPRTLKASVRGREQLARGLANVFEPQKP